MLCMFVLPPTLLIKVVNSGSFHWALSVFIYFLVAGHGFIYWTAPEIVRSSVRFFFPKQSVVMNRQINPGLFLDQY